MSLATKSGRFMVVMQMSTVPCSARSAGTWAAHSAERTTTSSSPATTSYQYQPPSTKGLRGSSNSKVEDASSPVVTVSTRCERPLAIER